MFLPTIPLKSHSYREKILTANTWHWSNNCPHGSAYINDFWHLVMQLKQAKTLQITLKCSSL